MKFKRTSIKPISGASRIVSVAVFFFVEIIFFIRLSYGLNCWRPL